MSFTVNIRYPIPPSPVKQQQQQQKTLKKNKKQTGTVLICDVAGCSLIGRATDRHAAEAGSNPLCGNGLFSQSQLSVYTLLRCPYTPLCRPQALTYVCTLKIL